MTNLIKYCEDIAYRVQYSKTQFLVIKYTDTKDKYNS